MFLKALKDGKNTEIIKPSLILCHFGSLEGILSTFDPLNITIHAINFSLQNFLVLDLLCSTKDLMDHKIVFLLIIQSLFIYVNICILQFELKNL